MEKVDFKKELKHLYRPSPKVPVVVDVPKMNFLMVDGRGNPNTSKEYRDAIEVLYGLSYPVKFAFKKAGILDYTVMPLEGLWWVEGSEEFDPDKKENWQWTSMIMQPDLVTDDLVVETIDYVKEKKDLAALSKIRLESFHERLSVQIMHIGPWSAEAPTIQRLHDFAEEQGYTLRGKHHEIYLGDPRRTAPEKLKTVIRQPVG
ncbi:MAG: GyrI-like domain-containing protein [Candidatus Sifarchaeia archaeon]